MVVVSIFKGGFQVVFNFGCFVDVVLLLGSLDFIHFDSLVDLRMSTGKMRATKIFMIIVLHKEYWESGWVYPLHFPLLSIGMKRMVSEIYAYYCIQTRFSR